MEELKASRHGEVSILGETMRIIYEELVTMHKAVVCLHDMQHKCKDNAKALKAFHTTITIVHEWSMKYKGVPSKLAKKIRQHANLDKTRVDDHSK